eukprot:scaffold166677_cov13-Tisochrysis_lutea.AAC.1
MARAQRTNLHPLAPPPPFCAGLHDGRRVRRCVQDRRCPHRAHQAADPEPGRDDQAGPPV